MNEVVPAGRLHDRVREVAGELAGNAPVTLRVTKEEIRRLQAARRGGDADDLIVQAYLSEDFREGVSAFLRSGSRTFAVDRAVSHAAVSLLALLAVIVISCVTPINLGFLSIALAFLIGHFMAGLPVPAIVSGFPGSLFLTLTGITLLFAQARVNGTLDKVAARSTRLARGNRA